MEIFSFIIHSHILFIYLSLFLSMVTIDVNTPRSELVIDDDEDDLDDEESSDEEDLFHMVKIRRAS